MATESLVVAFPSVDLTVADVLRRAAYLIDEFGWRQGSPGSRNEGSMCAVGAIMQVADDLGLLYGDDIERRACAINGWPGEGAIWPLALWNDEPGRTADEVVSRLREAAADGA